MLHRAKALGITPNTVMYNMALHSLIRANRYEDARNLFNCIPVKDIITFQLFMGACAARAAFVLAEMALWELQVGNWVPNDCVYFALIAAYR